MKNRIFRALALALALMLLCGAALADVLTTGNVWMRSEPSRDGDQITSIPEGVYLKYQGETRYDERPVAWYLVTYGGHTGWVSSMYSKLIGEESIVVDDDGSDGESDGGTADAGETGGADGSWFTSGEAVEVSGYYKTDLLAAAYALALPKFRNDENSEVPYQYYNDAVTLAGNQQVESIGIIGAGYAVYGVTVGTPADTAKSLLAAAGLDMQDGGSDGIMTFEHRGEDGGFVDEFGHDSCIDLEISGGKVVEIDWSTYTG